MGRVSKDESQSAAVCLYILRQRKYDRVNRHNRVEIHNRNPFYACNKRRRWDRDLFPRVPSGAATIAVDYMFLPAAANGKRRSYYLSYWNNLVTISICVNVLARPRYDDTLKPFRVARHWFVSLAWKLAYNKVARAPSLVEYHKTERREMYFVDVQ